jgi:thiamine biosynthesis lipoprotein
MIRLQQQRKALGSDVVLTLVGENEARLTAAFEDLWQALGLFEQTFSRFLPDSELSYVNEQAGLPTPVSQEFVALARSARRMTQATEGLYNPFVLPALQRAGYKGSWPSPETQGETPDHSSRQIVPGTQLKIQAQTVHIPHGSALDFGGIGKGYALDELAAVLRKLQIGSYWLSLGGDIRAAGQASDGLPWRVGVASAVDETSVSECVLDETLPAIATSTTLKRAGKGWNHLIDPRTGQSTQSDIVMSTVAAATGVEADVYAKCLLLIGSKAAPVLAEKLGITQYLLQIRGESDRVDIVKRGEFA